jgi:hypothetical protein
MARYYKLLPRHGIQVFTGGEDGRTFVKMFRNSWRRLPLNVRRRIMAHWRLGNRPVCPIVEFSNMWIDSWTVFGQVTGNGREIRFSAADFVHFPPSIAQWIIAHELAHVYQKAVGKLPGGTPGGPTIDENEREADDLAEGWGFDKVPRMIFDMQRSRGRSIEDACQVVIKLGLGEAVITQRADREPGHGLPR